MFNFSTLVRDRSFCVSLVRLSCLSGSTGDVEDRERFYANTLKNRFIVGTEDNDDDKDDDDEEDGTLFSFGCWNPVASYNRYMYICKKKKINNKHVYIYIYL